MTENHKQEIALPSPFHIRENVELLLGLGLFSDETYPAQDGCYYRNDGAGNYDYFCFKEGVEFIAVYNHESVDNFFGNMKQQTQWLKKSGLPAGTFEEFYDNPPHGETFTWATSVAWFEGGVWFYAGSLKDLNYSLRGLKERLTLPEAVDSLKDYYGIWEGEYWDEDFANSINDAVKFFPDATKYYDCDEPTLMVGSDFEGVDWNFVSSTEYHTQAVVGRDSTGFVGSDDIVLIPWDVFTQEDRTEQ